MEGSKSKTRRELAMDFEDGAAKIIAGEDVSVGDAAVAQVAATLALTCRVAELTEKVEDGASDIEDAVERFRVALEERPLSA